MSLIVLGNVVFDGFEVPSRVRFGGAQSVKIHKLIGGGRIIDALGRDDAALSWSGILSGSFAADRARQLDALRAAGNAKILTWDAFSYSVVIAQLEFDFCNPWWIPYHISCMVQSDLSQSPQVYVPPTISTILSDISSATSLLDAGSLPALAEAPAMIVSGVAGQAAAREGLTAAQESLDQMIQYAGLGLGSGDILEMIDASGSLAKLSSASGFLGRSIVNIDGALF